VDRNLLYYKQNLSCFQVYSGASKEIAKIGSRAEGTKKGILQRKYRRKEQSETIGGKIQDDAPAITGIRFGSAHL
jgi:hypothetical protein